MPTGLTFEQLIQTLNAYWQKQGCLLWLPYHEAVGAGTFNTATILRVLGPEAWNVAYVEPSFRADDGRFAENPNRVQMHHQYQVILKPIPENAQQLYLGSLEAIGLDIRAHDVRFVEDNWESPALGAWGLGWEVWLDGMEVTQYTYFQQAGGQTLNPPACELTYGLERIAMYLQGVSSIWDLRWNEQLTMTDVLKNQEIEFCQYNFNQADVTRQRSLYDLYLAESKSAVAKGSVVPALDYLLRCSNTFNILDTRGAIGLAERVKFFGEMRVATRTIAETFIKQRETAGFPLGKVLPPPSLGALPAPAKPKAEKEDLLIELGFEELAAWVPDSYSLQLEIGLKNILAAAKISSGAVESFATPRRISISIKDVQTTLPARSVEVKGPAKSLCEKNPKALEGFCKKAGAELTTVTYRVDAGSEYAFIVKQEAERLVASIIQESLPGLVTKFKCEKNMRWFASEEKVSAPALHRPIRWIVALLGEQIIPLEIAGVRAGRTTLGGRWVGCPGAEVSRASIYVETLIKLGITPQVAKRTDEVRAKINAAAASFKLSVLLDEGLITEVTQMVERPVAFAGVIAEKFFTLPNPVLIGIMSKHSRCFGLSDANGNVRGFVGISNGETTNLTQVKEGFERVMVARLTDAQFFISRDSSKTLEDFRERVKTLTFVEKLGSMFDKTERLKKLTPIVAKTLGFKLDDKALVRAAELSKADLGSQMVVEMSALQGIMGEEYAKKAGETQAVATSLREQYLPTAPGGTIAKSELGIALAVSDRLDTLVGLFSIGAEPTGSADPFGLRREALAIISTVLERKLPVDLSVLAKIAAETIGVKHITDTLARTVDFLEKRLEVTLREKGFRADSVRAVLTRHGSNPARALEILEELEALRRDATFETVATAHLRCLKILDHAREKGIGWETGDTAVNPSLFEDPSERELASVLSTTRATVSSLRAGISTLGPVAPIIHRFFDSVMVMSPNESVRKNRLSMVAEASAGLEGFADFRALEGAAK